MTHNIIILGRVCCPECLSGMIRRYGVAVVSGSASVSSRESFCEFCG